MEFYDPQKILRDVREKIKEVRQRGGFIDYLTFVPDGETTLDRNLGQAIDLLKSSGLKIAVITNASLIWREDVREDLLKADWISLKMDTENPEVWHRINRPHGDLKLQSILEGARQFAAIYQGELATETMLVKGINDADETMEGIGEILARLEPSISYLAVPTRPPAERWVQSPGEEFINRAFQILRKKVDRVEYLLGYEGNAFAYTGNAEQDLLNITAVHPMREEAVDDFLERAGAESSVAADLCNRGKLIKTRFEGHIFYVRKFRNMYSGREEAE